MEERMRKAGLYGAATLLTLISITLANAQNTPANAPVPINGPGSTLSQTPRKSTPHSPHLPYGLQLMARFDLLPTLRDTKCVQDSSYDRTGGNGDANNFLKRDGNKVILSDIRGPGCIYRFWSANAAGHLKIYFDGENAPRIDCPMQDLFLGKVAPFVQPIVGHRSGGWYSFFPMPFARGCRIEVTDPGPMYYHVEYQLFPDGAPVRTFTPQLSSEDAAALDTILQQWRHLGDSPYVEAPDQSVNGGIPLPAGQTRTVAELHGAGEIRRLAMKIAPADRNTLRQTVLRVYWDGAAKPGIEAPLGDFFGVGFGDQRFAALPDAMTDKGYVCYWPMPYGRSARIEIANLGKTDLSQATWDVGYRKLRRMPPDVGYFHAQWHRQTTVAGEHFHILQTSGRGHYVGEHTDMQGDRGIGFLEGDEKFYIDGETFPSIYGTGTEDFYTGGWYFDEGPFNLAYHGCTVKSDEQSRVAAYRYQIQDCVPFQHDIKVDIEHGGTNDYPGADYSCVAYWYQDSRSHEWSPIDPAQLTPAHYRIGGALEAEDLAWTGGMTKILADDGLSVEASGGKVMELIGPTGGTDPSQSTFTLHVDHDDVYTLHFAELVRPDSPASIKIIEHDPATSKRTGTTEIGHDNVDHEDRVDYSYPSYLKQGDYPLTLETPSDHTRYLDYVRLEPAPHLKGVIEGENLVGRAIISEGSTIQQAYGAQVNLEYGNQVEKALSGLGMMTASLPNAGATLKLPISVSSDGDYELELGLAIVNSKIWPGSAPALTARFDDIDLPGTLDLPALPVSDGNAPDFRVQRVRVGRLTGVKNGEHTLTLTKAGGGNRLNLDYIRLQRSRYPNTLEAESLKVLDAKDGEATTQEMTGFGPGWSGDAQFWFLGQKAGAEATLELPVAVTGKYHLAAYYTTARDYGICQVLVDGQPVGPPTDCYTPNVLAKSKTDLGDLDLTAGAHRITFRAVDKNPASSNYLLGVDAIALEPVR
jgi:hypothetical protein